MSDKNKRKRDPKQHPVIIVFLNETTHMQVFPLSNTAVVKDETGESNPRFLPCYQVPAGSKESPEEIVRKAREDGRKQEKV